MGWWPFRRDTSGRHALGAAVTAIPSGPLRVVTAPVAAPVTAVARPDEPSLEELLAAYGHLLPDPSVVPEPELETAGPPTLAPAPEAVPAPESAVLEPGPEPDPEPDPDGLAWLSAQFVGLTGDDGAQPAEAPAAVVVPAQGLPPFVPSQASTGAATPARVHLGFRDGSTAALEPHQARALEDLARALTCAD